MAAVKFAEESFGSAALKAGAEGKGKDDKGELYFLALSAGSLNSPNVINAEHQVVFECTHTIRHLVDLGVSQERIHGDFMSWDTITNGYMLRMTVQALLAKTGLTVGDFDVIESNEAFAAQAIAVNRELGLDPAKVNPNGGAIALGHPVGATGAIITVKAMYELERIGGKRALITMCIGGGQGIALAIER